MHRSRITIQTDTSNPDAPQPSFTGTLVTDWPATVKAVGGGESLNGRQIEANVTWVVEAHWGGAITAATPRNRITVSKGEYAGRLLNIERIVPVEGRAKPHAMEFHCSEIA